MFGLGKTKAHREIDAQTLSRKLADGSAVLVDVREPDEFAEWDRMDPSLGSPVVAWLASDKAAHVTGQIIRVVGDEIVLMEGWSNGNSIKKPGKRWEASELTALMNADIFKSRAPGLRY